MRQVKIIILSCMIYPILISCGYTKSENDTIPASPIATDLQEKIINEDIFDDLHIEFSGVDGSGVLTYETPNDVNIQVSANQEDFLYNGDIVTISVRQNDTVISQEFEVTTLLSMYEPYLVLADGRVIKDGDSLTSKELEEAYFIMCGLPEGTYWYKTTFTQMPYDVKADESADLGFDQKLALAWKDHIAGTDLLALQSEQNAENLYIGITTFYYEETYQWNYHILN